MSKSRNKAKDGAIATAIIVFAAFMAILLLWQKLDALRQVNPPAFAGVIIIISVVCCTVLFLLVYRNIE